MTNPLFAPKQAPRTTAAPGPVTIESEDKALRATLPAGWSGSCEIRMIPPNGRYLFVDADSGDGALIYAGHADLPQRYVVPGPWMGPVASGQRVKFGDGATAQWLFAAPVPASPAGEMARHLIARRFGHDAGVYHVKPLPELMARTAGAASAAGVQLGFVDACEASFSSADNAAGGVMRLVVFGHANPGGTWQVEDISGFRCSSEATAETYRHYEDVMASLKVGEAWRRDHPDEVPQAIRDDVAAKLRQADRTDIDRAVAARTEIDAIRRGIAGRAIDRRADVNGLL